MNDTVPTVYVEGEGPAYLDQCMAAAFAFCKASEIKVMVIFTSTGEGPEKAVDRYRSQEQFADIRLVAITPPAKRQYRDAAGEPVRAGIAAERVEKLRRAEVAVASARLPFRSILAQPDPIKPPGAEGPVMIATASNFDAMNVVDRVLGMFGGGLSLCVQAVLMACDAGFVSVGERVVAISADTAVALHACQSESFLSPHVGMLVDHIICRPRIYQISKPHHYVTQAWVDEEVDREDDDDEVLPAGADVPELPAGDEVPGTSDDPERA